MSIFDWSENLLTGLQELDAQHKKIFKFLNSIYEYNKLNPGNEDVTQKIQSLLDFIYQHFEYEENLMIQYNLNDFEDHKREHALFKEKVSELFEKFESSSYALAYEFCKFVKDFYLSHITYYDKSLAKKIKEQFSI